MDKAAGEAESKDRRPPVVIVTGPTGSGKSRLALDLAEDLAAEGLAAARIVNGDALQIYRDLRILSARPGPEEEARVPHRLYGTLPATEVCSAGRWCDLARAELDAALAAGGLPLVVGGSGLYLRALEQGISPIPEVPEAIRAAARTRHADLGGPAFHAALAARDPEAGTRLRPSDSQRLIRAWEVLEATGRSLYAWQAEPAAPPPYRFLRLALIPPRAELYAACDRRFLAMLEQGALAEVEALLAQRLDPGLPAMKAVGVPELAAYLTGSLSLAAATERAQQATRRYAKRQYTWLRGPGAGARIFGAQYSESLRAEIFRNLCDFILTP